MEGESNPLCLFGRDIHVSGYITGILYGSKGLANYTFYGAVLAPRLRVEAHIWYATVFEPKSHYYHCSLYEGGQILDPATDVRFAAAIKRHFPRGITKGAWVNCSFPRMEDLLDFLASTL